MRTNFKRVLSPFFLQISPRPREYSVRSLLQPPPTKHETSAVRRRPNTSVRNVRSKCAGTESPRCASVGAARGYGTDTTAASKMRRKRYISQNDMLAILDYHNKVRGKVFPPASNMEYMVSQRLHSFPLNV